MGNRSAGRIPCTEVGPFPRQRRLTVAPRNHGHAPQVTSVLQGRPQLVNGGPRPFMDLGAGGGRQASGDRRERSLEHTAKPLYVPCEQRTLPRSGRRSPPTCSLIVMYGRESPPGPPSRRLEFLTSANSACLVYLTLDRNPYADLSGPSELRTRWGHPGELAPRVALMRREGPRRAGHRVERILRRAAMQPRPVDRSLRGRSDVPYSGWTYPDGAGLRPSQALRGRRMFHGRGWMLPDRAGLCEYLVRFSGSAEERAELRTFNP